MQKFIHVWSALAAALPAVAQPPAAPSSANVANVGGTPPYRSAFADYKPWRAPELQSWRAANDDAGALGGHMGHVRGNVERMPGGAAVPAMPTKAGPVR